MATDRAMIAACLFVAACGGEPESTPPVVDSKPTTYEDMNFEQSQAFMQTVVLPRMTETFVAFDPKFEGMDCTTCHGSSAT